MYRLSITGTTREGFQTINYVYVIHQSGHPLTQVHPGHARTLLLAGKAKVVSKEPLTIQLLYKTAENVQELTLDIDPGSGTAGFAVVDTENA
jgi:hypothetical protein